MKIRYNELFTKYLEETISEKEIHHCCILCGCEFNDYKLNRCPECGGALDAIYNLKQFQLKQSQNPIEKYFSLLPIQNKKNILWFGDGNTPCIHSKNLGKYLGMKNLFLKDETVNPTRSTKDRIASVGLSRFQEIGIKKLVVSSTGNSSTAYARGVQLSNDFELHVFVGKDFTDRLNYIDNHSVHTHVISDDFVSAGENARKYSEEKGMFFEGGFFSISRREALKLAYLESLEQMDREPEYVFQAVSSGMGLLGAYKGFMEYKALGRLENIPKFIAVQQETCAPMAKAFSENSEAIHKKHIIKNPSGSAYAILRGDPSQSYPYINYICRTTDGSIISVSQYEIRLTQNLLFEMEGLRVCPASAVALAGMIKMVHQKLISPNAPVLVNLTGGERAFAQMPTQSAI